MKNWFHPSYSLNCFNKIMRHLKAHRKLGRTTEHRMSMLRNLAMSLINSEKGYIVTTTPAVLAGLSFGSPFLPRNLLISSL